MYAYIKGTLTHSTPSNVIVEANGIGYCIAIPVSMYRALPTPGNAIQLFTSFIVRENTQALYGFSSVPEKEIFETVITVSGIGPKIGLAVIGHLPLKELQQAIANKDHKTITRVPGIGKRTAERLIMELHDKLPALFPRDMQIHGAKPETSRQIQDATSALVNLGYTQAMAQMAMERCQKEIDAELPLSELISCALSKI